MSPAGRSRRPSGLWRSPACAAAASSLALVLTSDAVSGDVGEPLVIALLSSWITVSYVLCGLIAWLRRPASRFGPLMIAAGFASFLTDLSWTTQRRPVHDRAGARPSATRALLARVPGVSERPAARSVRAGSDRDGVRDRDRAPSSSGCHWAASARTTCSRLLQTRGGPGGAACSARGGQRVLPVRSRHPCCSSPTLRAGRCAARWLCSSTHSRLGW